MHDVLCLLSVVCATNFNNRMAYLLVLKSVTIDRKSQSRLFIRLIILFFHFYSPLGCDATTNSLFVHNSSYSLSTFSDIFNCFAVEGWILFSTASKGLAFLIIIKANWIRSASGIPVYYKIPLTFACRR